MNSQRAEEILHSSDKIDVKLNGHPVWIESVNTRNNQVNVHMGDDPTNRKTVLADELVEVK
jgi:small acid-soluble spore protein H (minor)